MFLDLLPSPVRRQAYTSRMQNALTNRELRQNNIILGNVADDFLVLLNIAWHSIDLRRPTSAGLLAHQDVDKRRLTGA